MYDKIHTSITNSQLLTPRLTVRQLFILLYLYHNKATSVSQRHISKDFSGLVCRSQMRTLISNGYVRNGKLLSFSSSDYSITEKGEMLIKIAGIRFNDSTIQNYIKTYSEGESLISPKLNTRDLYVLNFVTATQLGFKLPLRPHPPEVLEISKAIIRRYKDLVKMGYLTMNRNTYEVKFTKKAIDVLSCISAAWYK